MTRQDNHRIINQHQMLLDQVNIIHQSNYQMHLASWPYLYTIFLIVSNAHGTGIQVLQGGQQSKSKNICVAIVPLH